MTEPIVTSQTSTSFPLPGSKAAASPPKAELPPVEETMKLESSEEAETRVQKKARLARVLERGFVHDRLIVSLPSHLVGEWVRKDQMSIARKQALGFRIDDEYATQRSLHSDGEGNPVVGDVIFMVTERENFELFEEIRRDQFRRMNTRPKQQREEEDLAANVEAYTGGDIKAFTESQAHGARPTDIQEALLALATQNKPQ